MTESSIPEEQFGFHKGRSTIQSVTCLQMDIEEALRKPTGKLHCVFIDYVKAFDLLNRTLIITKLEEINRKESCHKTPKKHPHKKFYSNR